MSTMTNQAILAKADLALSDLTTGGGLLAKMMDRNKVFLKLLKPSSIDDIRGNEKWWLCCGAPLRVGHRLNCGQRIFHRMRK